MVPSKDANKKNKIFNFKKIKMEFAIVGEATVDLFFLFEIVCTSEDKDKRQGDNNSQPV